MFHPSTPKFTVFYDDIGKTASDLLGKGYANNGTFKISTETKEEGFSFKTASTRSVKTDNDGKKHEVINAVIEPKFEWKEHNITFEGKFATANELSVTGSAKDFGVDNSKLSISAAQRIKADVVEQTITAGVEIQNEMASFKICGGYPLEPRAITTSGSLSVQPIENVLVGVKVDAEFGNGTKTTTKGEIKLAASNEHFAGHFVGTHDKKIAFTLYHKLASYWQWGMKIDYDTQSDSKGPSLEVGSLYKVDDHCTLQAKTNFDYRYVTKLKSEHGLRLAIGATQNLNKNVSAVIGADLNVRQLLGAGGSCNHSFGFEVKLK